MGMAAAILIGMGAALLAPGVYALTRRWSGWALAVVPASLFAYFASFLGKLPADGVLASYPWAPDFGLQWSLRLDGLSLLFCLLISGMGAIVLVYAGGYLAGDDRLGRLYTLLLAFMASMLGLALSDNFIAMFVFWELTSILSYMLIGFNHERAAARAAALQALIITGGGGLALLAGFVLLSIAGVGLGLPAAAAQGFSGWEAAGVSASGHPLYAAILALTLLGAFTKSAQFPFHFWLPGAMEAPTPVSAYLHSATMVKAGVFLLARLTPLLGGTDQWQWSLIGIGATTMLVGALLAVQATDLKLILAQSTVSALGLLTLLLGIGSADAMAAAMTFLLAHALYKGALFLVAGGVDHGAGTRDVGELAGLRRKMPVTAAAAAAAACSLAAVPPLFGFIAKESIYETVLHEPALWAVAAATIVASALFVVVAVMTGLAPFWGTPSAVAAKAHEVSPSEWLGPATLAAAGAALGVAPWLVDQPLLAAATRAALHRPEPQTLKLALWHGWNLALGMSIATLAAGLAAYRFRRGLARGLAPFSAWGTSNVYERGLAGFLRLAAWQTHVLQSGYLRYYLMTIIVSIIALIGYTAFFRYGTVPPLSRFSVEFHEAGICLLIPLAAWATIRAPSRLAAIVALGVVGYAVALIFVLYGAPDLAMTQFLVETLTVVLFVFAFYRLPTQRKISTTPARLRDAALAISLGAIMTSLVLFAIHGQRSSEVSDYYVEHSLPDAHGRNIVNVILVDFRAVDTLGEIFVLSLAAVGVYSLLKLRPREEAEK
jgi:multicomponent Na+:H+ antiporter subunit A